METTEKHATHTPGPWEMEDCTPGKSEGLCFAINSEHTIVARTTDGWKKAKANARLIAAAPDLLSQCREFEKCLTYLINSGDSGADLELDKLREVLAKVDGGEG
jgi:hypothetical protein